MTCSITSPIGRKVPMQNSMENLMSDRSENSSQIYDEMAQRVQLASMPSRPSDSVKAKIVRASIRLGLPFQRAKSIWYRAARRIEAHEADLIRSRTAHLGEIQQRMAEIDRLMDRLDTHGSQLSFDFAGADADADGKRSA